MIGNRVRDLIVMVLLLALVVIALFVMVESTHGDDGLIVWSTGYKDRWQAYPDSWYEFDTGDGRTCIVLKSYEGLYGNARAMWCERK